MLNITSIIEKTINRTEKQDSNLYLQTKKDELAIQIWRKYATGNSSSSLLEHVLKNEGLSFDEVTSKVKIKELEVAIHSKENLWVYDIQAIMERYHQTDKTVLLNSSEMSITQICLLPFIEYMQEKSEKYIYNAEIKHISKQAVKEYAYLLLNHLVFVADDTLLTCARSYEKTMDVLYWRDVPIKKSKLSFIHWFYSEGIIQMFNTYPLLLKKLITFTETHFKNFCAFVDNFQRDRELIADKFSIPLSEVKIRHISGNLSDSHHGGKTVMRLEMSSKVLYYKPRSLAVDDAWIFFISKLSMHNFPTQLYAPTTLNMGDYGYVQEIKYCESMPEQELHKYYRNAGGLCCIVSMLGGSDFHHENIIAYGKIPVLVDVETIITPKPASFYGLTEINKNQGVATHVGRTLMLQHWVGKTLSSSQDIGGFTSEETKQQNIPIIEKSIKKGAEYYIDDFVEGFQNAYDFFLKQKNIIQKEGWLNVFAQCTFRYVFRRTALYYSLIKHFYSATFMRDAMYFEGALSRFGAGLLLNFDKADAKKLWNIVLEEKRSARQGDIPYFICQGNSKALFTINGLCVDNFFEASPVELASRNLLLMSKENEYREVHYIKLDLNTCFTQKQFSNNTPLLSYQKINRSPMALKKIFDLQLIEEIGNLIDKINEFEMAECAFDYYAPVRNRKNTRYNIEVLPTDIYSGSLGILVVQAAYANLSNDRKLREAVLAKIAKICVEEFCAGRYASSLNLSYSQGISGLVQAAILIVDILGDDRLLKMVSKVVLEIPQEHLTRMTEFDFFGGLSGVLYYFSKLHQIQPNEKLREKIILLSNELLKRATINESGQLLWKTENEYRPLVGLAHGQSGIGIAFLESWKITEEPKLYETAQALFKYEKACFSKEENNWFDYRKFDVKLRDFAGDRIYKPRFMHGYCSGAPGIGISRIIASRQTNLQMYESDIDKVIEFCKKEEIIGNDSLCCGSCAWIDFLIEAAQYYNDPKLLAHAKSICAGIIPKNSGVDYILSNINGTYDISLFKGYSGIAYQFMRVLSPQEIPSVII